MVSLFVSRPIWFASICGLTVVVCCCFVFELLGCLDLLPWLVGDQELPDHLRDGLEVHFASTYDDVYKVAFEEN